MKSLKLYKWWAILLSICTMALGVSMIIWPETSALTACYLISIICIAMGVYKLIRYFDIGAEGVLFRFDLSTGIFNLLSGILLLCHPLGAVTILPIALGFYITMAGIFSIQVSAELRDYEVSNWWSSLAFGILGILLGVLMIFDPFTGATALMTYIGISLLVSGVQSIYTIICLSKAFKSKKHQKVIEAVYHECD